MNRPKGVTIIALWDFVGSIVCAVFFFLHDMDAIFESILLLGSILLLVFGIGLWRMKNWARVCTTIGTVVSLLISLVWTVLSPSLQDFSPPHIASQVISYVINLCVVVYLMTPRVKQAFLSFSWTQEYPVEREIQKPSSEHRNAKCR